jgi:hypothetical protein
MGCGMSDNQNTEINQPTDELNDEQLNEVAGGGGPQQDILPYMEQDNVYKAASGQNQHLTENITINIAKFEVE